MSFFSGLLPAIGTFFGGPVGGAIGTAIGGTMAANEQNAQNMQMMVKQQEFNRDEAIKNRDFQNAEAQQQMNFQERMASTQWTRAVGDMENAGLNPMLAVSQGPNAAPSGAAGSGSQAAPYTLIPKVNVQQAALQSAQQAATIQNTVKQGDLIDAQTEQTKADTLKSISTAKNLDADTTRIGMDTDRIQKQAMLLSSQNLTESQRYNLTKVQTELADIDKGVRYGTIDNLEAQTRLTKAQAALAELARAGATNEATFQGQVGELGPWGKAVGSILNGAGAAMRLGK